MVPASIRTSPARFEEEANYILSNFEVLPLVVALERLRKTLDEGGTWPHPTAVICFDDGFRSINESAIPLLTKMRCPSCIFANGAFVEQSAVSEALMVEAIRKSWSYDQIRQLFPDFREKLGFRAYIRRNSCRQQFELLNNFVGEEILAWRPYFSLTELEALPADFVTVANHTYRHLLMSNLTSSEQEEEILQNHALLSHLPNYQPVVCIPFGSNDSFNRSTETLMVKHNNRMLIKAVGGINHRRRDGLIEIERIGLNNNKPPIAQHIIQRTESLGFFSQIKRKFFGKILGGNLSS